MNKITAQGTILHDHYYYNLENGFINSYLKNKIAIARGLSIKDIYDDIVIIAYDDIAEQIKKDYKKGDLINFEGELRKDVNLKGESNIYILIKNILYVTFK